MRSQQEANARSHRNSDLTNELESRVRGFHDTVARFVTDTLVLQTQFPAG